MDRSQSYTADRNVEVTSTVRTYPTIWRGSDCDLTSKSHYGILHDLRMAEYAGLSSGVIRIMRPLLILNGLRLMMDRQSEATLKAVGSYRRLWHASELGSP